MQIDPLSQFHTKTLIPIKFAIGGSEIDLSFTNASLFMLLIPFLVLLVTKATGSRKDMVPSRVGAIVEIVFNFLDNLITEYLGKDGRVYAPLIAGVFLFIIAANMFGILPGAYTVTSQIIVNFCLALIVFITANVVGILKNGRKFFRLFCPEGTPIYVAPLLIVVEFSTYFLRPISLSIRLVANMMAGHVMLSLFADFSAAIVGFNKFAALGAILPILINTCLFGFEVLVALLQAYVFTVLTCIYFKDTLELH